MEEETEPALQAAGHVRARPLPACPISRTGGSAGDRSDRRALRAEGWRAASMIRRWRIADGGRARSARPGGPRRRKASAASEPAEARADDRHVGVDLLDRQQRHLDMAPSHVAHACGETVRWSRFMRCRRSRRGARHSGQSREPLEIPEIHEDPAATLGVRRSPARGCARRLTSPARANDPVSASASIVPLPDRVGTSDTTDAPQAKAASTERSSHCVLLERRNERRLNEQKDAQATRRAPPGRGRLA